MKRYEILGVVDEETFRKKFVDDLPTQWDADFRYENGSYYIYVNNLGDEPLERLLKTNNMRFIPMLYEEREYRGYRVSIAEDNDFFYINFNTGLGEGIYEKSEWFLDKAIEDQANLFKENV